MALQFQFRFKSLTNLARAPYYVKRNLATSSIINAPTTEIPTFSRSPQNSVSIPFMITSTTRQRLYDLEYTKTEVDELSPSQALLILSNNFTPESYGAYVRDTYQSKKTSSGDLHLPKVIQMGDGERAG